MNYLVYGMLILTAIMIVTRLRKNQDQRLLTQEVEGRGGRVIQLERVRKGSPFPDVTRGWWAWRVIWQDGDEDRTSWVLTTREGIGEWRD